MERLINTVFFVLFSSLLASTRRTSHLEEKGGIKTRTLEELQTYTTESAQNINIDEDKLRLQADGLEDAGESQSAEANPLMQEVRQADASSKTASAHKITQARGDAKEGFFAAMKVANAAIVTKSKAAARAEFYKSRETGSKNARESRKEADVAAAMLIDAETTLWEKTELLSGEAFGGEAIVKHLLQDYEQGEGTVEQLLEVFHMQIDQIDLKKFPSIEGSGSNLWSRLTALESQAKEMQYQQSNSNEIDLTKPSLFEKHGMHLNIVKWIVDFIKMVQFELLPIAVEKSVDGVNRPGGNQSEIVLDMLDGIEESARIESVINEATAKFVNSRISTSVEYSIATEMLKQAIRKPMEQLLTFNLHMYESQKDRISNAIIEKQKAIVEYATLKQRHRSPEDLKMRLHVASSRRSK